MCVDNNCVPRMQRVLSKTDSNSLLFSRQDWLRSPTRVKPSSQENKTLSPSGLSDAVNSATVMFLWIEQARGTRHNSHAIKSEKCRHCLTRAFGHGAVSSLRIISNAGWTFVSFFTKSCPGLSSTATGAHALSPTRPARPITIFDALWFAA
jgi:hypothetical protein